MISSCVMNTRCMTSLGCLTRCLCVMRGELTTCLYWPFGPCAAHQEKGEVDGVILSDRPSIASDYIDVDEIASMANPPPGAM